MSKSPLDSLGVTSQEAPAALQRLLDTQVISMVELEVALEHVRRQQPKSTRGFWIRSKLSRVVSGGEAVDVIDNDMPASTRVARRMKARENIRSQRFTLDDSISDTVPVLEKSHASVIFLTQALTNNESNVLFSSLSAYELQQLIGAMAPQEVAADTVIIEQGDLGDYFYVVEMGKVNFLVNGVLVGNCGPGASFGELALLYNAPRAATCKADSDCKLWKVDQYTFRFMLAKTQVSQNKHIHEILLKVPFLTDIGERALNKVNDALVTVNFKQGDRIFSKGQQGDTFYILDSGTVKVHDIGFGDTQFDDIELSSGAFFGERALLTGEPRAAHVTATSDCACLALSRESFEATLGPLQTLIDRAMTKRVMVRIPTRGYFN
jgi:CRP-like cAMP-binding protein